MKKLFLLSVILPLGVMAQNFDYLPAPVGNNQILTYSQFTLSYNEEHEQADWVAYELTRVEAERLPVLCIYNCGAAYVTPVAGV